MLAVPIHVEKGNYLHYLFSNPFSWYQSCFPKVLIPHHPPLHRSFQFSIFESVIL